jgi:hydrogenase large subunit
MVGNLVADPEKPLEVLRTVHSFDPWLAPSIWWMPKAGPR